jgi:hypothetical protein
MPNVNVRPAPYKKRRDSEASWDSFRKGLNLLLRPTELSREEYEQGDNIMLKGSGVPTGRWGTSPYFTAGATGTTRGFGSYKNTASLTNEIFALSDEGYLQKKVGTSSSIILGVSFPSGSRIMAEELGGKTYIVSPDVPMLEYTGSNVSIFATLSAPTGITATNFSGVSGSYLWSWFVTTNASNGGETTGVNVTLANLPQELNRTQINIAWTAPSAASGSIKGYSIYRGLAGDETFLSAVGASTTSYIDTGDVASDVILAPITNSTGGVKSKIIVKFNDRLLVVPTSDPTKLMISGRYPNQNKFTWADGGGYIYVDPDSGTDITGVAVQPGSDKIVVYKDFSHYAISLSTVNIGNYTVLDPQYQPISTSKGASTQDTIQTVENDTFYFGRTGLYVTGYEPNFLNVIRTNEISARIRPYLDLLNNADYTSACSMYVNQKYLLSFPNRKEIVCYDRERGCFAGIWKTPFGITSMMKYSDITGTERWVIGTDTNQTYTFEPSVNSDNGETITKTLRTNKEMFGTWSALKAIKLFYILFTNITGEVNVNILMEARDGSTSAIKTFTISGSAVAGNTGWGTNLWGNSQYGLTQGEIVIAGDELYKWGQLSKTGRVIQIEVSSTAANSNFELLNIRATANSLGDGSLNSSSRI